MLKRKHKTILWILIVVALIAGATVVYQRSAIESQNKNVEVVMGWEEFASNAVKSDYDNDYAFKEAEGKVNAFIFKELTIDDLIKQNFAVNLPGVSLRLGLSSGEYSIIDKNGSAVATQDISLDYNYLQLKDTEIAQSLLTGLHAKTNVKVSEYTLSSEGESSILIRYLDKGQELRDLGLTFNIPAMRQASEKGFYVIPRFTTWANYQEGDMAALVKPLEGIDCGGIMFNDKTVINIGSDEDTEKVYKDMALGLKSLNAPLVLVEFYNQKGLSDLIDAYDNNVVRLHSIADNEMAGTVTPESAKDRFILATTERNIRMIYLKTFPGKDFDGMMDYTASLTHTFENKGFTLAKAEPIPEIPLHNSILMLIALGIGAGGILLGERLRLLKLAAILSILMVVGCIGLSIIGKYVLAARILGLLSAMVFPSLALISWVGEKRNIKDTLITYFKMTGVTLIGAVYIVGLFPLQVYMNSISIFSGIKLGMITPLLLLLIFCLFLRKKENIFDRMTSLTKKTVHYGELLIFLILGLALLLLMLRSGNEGMTVSSLEQSFRTFLDHYLGVRPRTKEFLIGTPALILALYFGYKDYLLPLWLIGAIGQVSMLNTFCHFHTPLFISLLRTVNGIWVGILLGLIVIGVMVWLIKYKKRMEGKVL